MPELPEVESLRASLVRHIGGARVLQAALHRPDMLHRMVDAPAIPLPPGSVVRRLVRHGKQLVIETHDHGCLLVHLGMSGSLRLLDERQATSTPPDRHVHAHWMLRTDTGRVLCLRHRDPRRFGWLESHASIESVRTMCWDRLGPDALTVRAEVLADRLGGTRRGVKAALLDQKVTAGIGNIYVDESLFRARLHPCLAAGRLTPVQLRTLARVIRHVLRVAVRHGGSTIQDHRTIDGAWGSYQKLHLVYGRAGQPCRTCGTGLASRLVQQRMTVFCKVCQSRTQRRP